MTNTSKQPTTEKQTLKHKLNADPSILTRTMGVWTIVSLRESFSRSFIKPWNWVSWDKHRSALPLVCRYVVDVYTLNPSLVFFYLLGKVWRGVEPGITVYLYSRLFITLEAYLDTDGKSDCSPVIYAIIGHLLCVIITSLASSFQLHYTPKLESQVQKYYQQRLLRDNIRYDMRTLQSVDKMRLANYGTSWFSFVEICDAGSTLLSLFTITTSIIYHNHGGKLYTGMCLAYPLFTKAVTLSWSVAAVAYSENRDFIRTRALQNMSDVEFREDVINNNISEYIINEYSKASKGLGTIFTGSPFSELVLGSNTFTQLPRALSMEIPAIYFTYCALLEPTAQKMSSLAILRHQSSIITANVYTTFRLFSAVLYTLKNIEDLYEIKVPRLVDGTTEYHPQENSPGMELELRNVSFAWHAGLDSTVAALEGITLHIHAGQLVFIVGENGSGKSTLIKVLSRMYDVGSGTLLIDGCPIEEYRLSDLRDAMALLNQERSLFPVSLGENIGLGYAPHTEDKEMIRVAAEKGGATNVLKGLQDGPDTILNPVHTAYGFALEHPRHQVLEDLLDGLEVHKKVSGGEKQRLLSARTFMRLRSPKIKLVALDEPSSAMDSRGELHLFKQLLAEKAGRTIIFVTHRFRHLVRHADLIVCMKKGTIVESGQHKELLALNGEYAALYNMQAQAFTEVLG